MRTALKQILLMTLTAGLLTACGSTPSEPTKPVAETATRWTAPTESQAMVCDREIKGDVKQILQLSTEPKATSKYAHGLFTCTYALPMGTMRLSVQHSSTDAAGLSYLTARRAKVGANEAQLGLTDHAYATGTGIVLVLKDNETLEVDTTALPVVFGELQQKRVDLAYEVASDVLGCWTGHD